ncbi:hypothetical protein MSG28_015279 [Choristoneura fumiferana]|uniref:Uncharacterized protein n=1 Tax=Choristoneura fumiferana TaxID=7141 RepID=A0ACC0KAB8_CHOFU|nr:hypothetical protein MSG28_015279 [Choristoneura fumiferana]
MQLTLEPLSVKNTQQFRMAMDLVKEEAAWEAEYVEALWEALYAVHHEARSQATDLASPVARACDAKTRDPQPKTETPDPWGVFVPVTVPLKIPLLIYRPRQNLHRAFKTFLPGVKKLVLLIQPGH